MEAAMVRSAQRDCMKRMPKVCVEQNVLAVQAFYRPTETDDGDGRISQRLHVAINGVCTSM